MSTLGPRNRISLIQLLTRPPGEREGVCGMYDASDVDLTGRA
jgi:hypothetical protein